MKKKSSLFQVYGRTVVFLHDVLMIPAAWYLAYWLRFNLGTIPENSLRLAILVLPAVMVCQTFSYVAFGLYRGLWRFASLHDFIRIGKSVYVGALSAALVIFAITGMEGVPRSVIPLYIILLFIFLGGNRALYRVLKDRRMRTAGGKRALIIGAGESGQMLVRDMFQQNRREYLPTGMIDDDPDKLGREIHGVKVLGAFEDIPRVVKQYGIELMIIAIPSLSSERMRSLVATCESAGMPFKTLPRLEDLISGQVTVSAVQEVSIEDLLGRERVELDLGLMRAGLSGKVILITGGGGSIGAELCRQVAGFTPKMLIILERSEFNLYRIRQELERDYPELTLVAALGDVCEPREVESILKTHSPDMIFHAAAYKHVPVLEAHPAQAVKNNIVGTRIVAEAASKFHCGQFVFISTDKAVHPTSILGATKRVGELFCEAMNTVSDTRFITVRFGNVLGSDGSVVPLFREQIRKGGPLTVTHPDITRYFMTMREACQLILQASVMEGEAGIFVLDMGEPVRIEYLAEQMILLSGKEPGRDLEIRHIGLRPGEKLYEELFYDNESKEETGNDKVFRARHAPADWQRMARMIAGLEQALADMDDGEMKNILAGLLAHGEAADPAAAGLAPEGKGPAPAGRGPDPRAGHPLEPGADLVRDAS